MRSPMAHRKSLEQGSSVVALTKKLKTEKNEVTFEGSVNPEKSIIPGDVMDIILEYSGVDKTAEKLGFFNTRGLASLNAFHTKLEAHHRPRIAQLLDHVVKGRLVLAEAMIKENPDYLFESGDSMDYSG